MSALTLWAIPAHPQTAPQPPDASAGFTLLWDRGVPPLTALAMSPQASYIGMITQSSKLLLWTAEDGKKVWAQPAVDGRALKVSDQMGYVLVYNPMNRVDRTVSLYRAPITEPGAPAQPPTDSARPILAGKRTLSGAVWSSSVSLDGSYAACGTGDRQVVLISLGARPKFAPHPIDGIGNDIKFAPNNQYMVVGLWNQSGVETMDMQGRIRWSYLAANDRRYDISVSQESRKVLAIAYSNHARSDVVLSLLSDQGIVLWSYGLGDGAYAATAKIGLVSNPSYVSFTQIVRRHRLVMPQRCLIALSPGGDVLWTRRGGVFFSPELMCLTPDGNGAIAYDGSDTLYRLDSDGNIIARDKLSGALVNYAVSHDRKRLVVNTSDGQLSMLGIG